MSMKLAPEIKFNKNGYEIRTDVLEMAKEITLQEYKAKFGEWEMSVEKNKDGSVTHKVKMPDFPNMDIFLANAERLYSFINQGK